MRGPDGKNYLPGGILLCLFPAVVLVAMHLNGASMPMPWPILFGLFFLYGVRTVVTSLGWMNMEGVVSWVIDAVAAAGFGAFCVWVAWVGKDGWSGGLPFVPDSWNQGLARIVFGGLGGLIGGLFGGRCLLKAYRQFRGRPDGGMFHS